MGQFKITSVVPAPRLRFETINDRGIGWPSTAYSGFVILVREAAVPDADGDLPEPVTFFIPEALSATRPPKQPMVVETGVRAFRTASAPGPVHGGAYDARVDFVPGPRGGKELWPQLTFLVAGAGIDYLQINYRVVVEDY
jgi:hypothetical protein